MKQFISKKAVFIILSIFLFTACSSDDNDDAEDSSEFAMTFKINDELFELNNPFGTNEYSNTNIFTYYPIEDFVLLQSRNGLIGTVEINLWLKRDQIIEGATYSVNEDTDGTGTSTHIDLIDSRNDIFEDTVSGEVTILSVNTSTKVVSGVFEFVSTDIYETDAPVLNVTEGTFNYIYED